MFTKFSTSTSLRFFDLAIQLAERWIRFVNCWPRFSFLLRQQAIIEPIALMFIDFLFRFSPFFHILLVAQSSKKKKSSASIGSSCWRKVIHYYCYQFVHNISDGLLFGMHISLWSQSALVEMIIGKLASISIIFIKIYFFYVQSKAFNVFTWVQRIYISFALSHTHSLYWASQYLQHGKLTEVNYIDWYSFWCRETNGIEPTMCDAIN